MVWTGSLNAPSPDAALLDVFVKVRTEVSMQERIRFLVKLPHKSPLWRHQADLMTALPRCTIQGPGPGDADLMAAAASGLLPEPKHQTHLPEQPLSLPPLTVAADGSVRRSFSGHGWLACDGQYGLRGRVDYKRVIGSRPPLVAELRAIDDAVSKLMNRRLTIYCDNSYAVSMARRWMDGQEVLPDRYMTERVSGKRAGLVVARQRIHANRHRLDIRWARGHQGEPLNEGADALARLASRYVRGDSGLSPAEYRERAEGVAKAFSACHRQLDADS